MNLNDLLLKAEIDPKQVLVLRHRPTEPELNKVLPWLAAERQDLFNAYQQTQGGRLEPVIERLVGKGYIAAFIGLEAGKAVFVGLYEIVSSRPLSFKEFWRVPAYIEMKAFGMKGWYTEVKEKPSVLWFDLDLKEFYQDWKGKLVVGWPPPERSWWRRAHRNVFPILSVREESAFDAAMPEWNVIDFSWQALKVLPARWKSVLAQWRGIYYIFDTSDGKGYIGSAYGEQNILGRWMGYATKGDGGNRLLRPRDPNSFRFTIIQRVSPDMEPREVVQIENSWKERLHTREPFGLNDN